MFETFRTSIPNKIYINVTITDIATGRNVVDEILLDENVT